MKLIIKISDKMERSDIERGITKKRSDCCKNKGTIEITRNNILKKDWTLRKEYIEKR